MAGRPDPLELATRALRHRDRSRSELDRRLAEGGIAEEERSRTLDTLERVGYLDDRRFAEGRAQTLAGRGYGDDAIRSDLDRQGLGPDVAEDALAGLEPERDRAHALVRRLGGRWNLAAQLLRRGFGEDTVEAVLSSTLRSGSSGL